MKIQPVSTRTADAPEAAAVSTDTAKSPAPTTSLRRLRRRHVLAEYPISPRTLSNWQRRHVIPFEKIGRTVLFKREDIEAALARFRHAAVGELTKKN